jgi:hypothetical protein
MMLFDPDVGPSIKGWIVAGRQGGRREIMRASEGDNERKRNSETNKQTKNQILGMSSSIWGKTREGSPRPRG